MEEKYSGTPSIQLDHRPFFSIVIACYNPRKYLKELLNSIIAQKMNDDIEVILSDDHSTENYDDIVSEYDETLCIKRVQTDYNFAPGNTRERGTLYTTGKWLCFADQDDVFVDDKLSNVKKTIIDKKETVYAVANFLQVNPTNDEIINAYYRPLGWNHAKYYNLDTWRKYNIHFVKDLVSHEDVYISSVMNCIMNSLNREPLYIDEYTYIWYSRPESISHRKYVRDNNQHLFLEKYLPDYIRATGDVYIDQYMKGIISREYAVNSAAEILAYCYFYMQGFIFDNPKGFLRKNFEWCRGYLIRIKKLYQITNVDIWNLLAANGADRYMQVEHTAHIGVGPYIPYFTLMEWMEYLHKDGDPYPTENVLYTNKNKENNLEEENNALGVH